MKVNVGCATGFVCAACRAALPWSYHDARLKHVVAAQCAGRRRLVPRAAGKPRAAEEIDVGLGLIAVATDTDRRAAISRFQLAEAVGAARGGERIQRRRHPVVALVIRQRDALRCRQPITAPNNLLPELAHRRRGTALHLPHIGRGNRRCRAGGFHPIDVKDARRAVDHRSHRVTRRIRSRCRDATGARDVPLVRYPNGRLEEVRPGGSLENAGLVLAGALRYPANSYRRGCGARSSLQIKRVICNLGAREGTRNS